MKDFLLITLIFVILILLALLPVLFPNEPYLEAIKLMGPY